MENIEDIRRLYIDDLSQESEESRNGYFDLIPAEVAAAQFDAVIRKIQADAWDRCLDEIEVHEINTQQAREGNPYRTTDSEEHN